VEGTDHLDPVKLVTGGQTGVDRAMLDFCLEHRIPCGGWCPGGRKAEDGTIDAKYPLQEIPEASYHERTAANVRDSDATVIICHGELNGGTLESYEFAQKEGRPCLLLDMSLLNVLQASTRLKNLLAGLRPGILNFSGPRQSEWPEGYETCYGILRQVFA
jgi:hypothetical protein